MDSKEPMKLALEHAKRDERHASHAETRYWCRMYRDIAEKAVEALAEQPARQQVGINGLTEAETNATASVMGLVNKTQQQEPVQRYSPDGEGGMEVDSLGAWMKFTSPPAQRTWVSLTDEDIEFLRHELVIGRNDIKAIEAKLQEKNK